MSDNDAKAVLAAQYGLSDAQSAFLIALCNEPTLDVVAAGAAVGLGAKGAKAMIRQPEVMRAFRAQVQDRNNMLRTVRDNVLMQLVAYTQYDVGDMFGAQQGPDGTQVMVQLAPHELPDSLRLAVTKAKPTKYGWEYTFPEKSKILLALLSHFSSEVSDDRAEGGAQIRQIVAEYYDTADPKMEALKAGKSSE